MRSKPFFHCQHQEISSKQGQEPGPCMEEQTHGHDHDKEEGPDGGRYDEVENDWHALARARKKRVGLFVILPDLEERFALLGTVLKVTDVLQHKGFALSSLDFDKIQARESLKGEPRKYRVVETAKGAVTSPARLLAMESLNQQPLCLPTISFNAKARSLLFRMFSAFLCSIEASLARFHRGFPYALFLILGSREEAEKAYSIPSCMHDELATYFFGKYPSIDDGLSTPATAFLVALAIQIEVATCHKVIPGTVRMKCGRIIWRGS